MFHTVDSFSSFSINVAMLLRFSEGLFLSVVGDLSTGFSDERLDDLLEVFELCLNDFEVWES